MRFLFLTSTPLDVERGSGTFVGIHTLREGLRGLGATVDLVGPNLHLPVYTLERIFQESLNDYWLVMETLTAFVRERARWKGNRTPLSPARSRAPTGPKIRRVAARIPFAKEALSVWYCAKDDETPLAAKGMMFAALAYFAVRPLFS